MAEIRSKIDRILSETPVLTHEELLDAFENIPAHRLWIAIVNLVARLRDERVELAKDPELSEKGTNMLLGGLEALDNLLLNSLEYADIASKAAGDESDAE